MKELDKKKLIRGAAALGIELDERQVRQFEGYAELLQDWNRRINLTRVPPADVVTRHFLDSLTVLRAAAIKTTTTLLDVGTGAGFPGLPLRIARPNISLTLLDSTRKKLDFLRTVCENLGLARVETVHRRVEIAGAAAPIRESFDVVTARAVAQLDVLVEYVLPCARVGGLVIAQKSATADDEIDDAREAIEILGGRLQNVVRVTLPDSTIERQLVVIEKRSATPREFPRSQKKIRTAPLGAGYRGRLG